VHPLTKLNATVTSQLPAETAWLTAKHCKVFPIQFKYHSIKTMKSTYLYYKRCWKRCLCTSTLSVPFKNRLKLCHEEELCELNSITNYFGRKHVCANETMLHCVCVVCARVKRGKWRSTSPSWTDCKNQLQKLILLAKLRGCKAWTTVTLYSWC
jgi:hypothetical protein